ncbi:uncharacterized protein LOC143911265 [Arctopsyche grandis]|uniref:uncharacterized protein LOC143911265 n=1 Tax=Arctopsyche grandis TaxID=121162 RepID=UPI00406D7D74
MKISLVLYCVFTLFFCVDSVPQIIEEFNELLGIFGEYCILIPMKFQIDTYLSSSQFDEPNESSNGKFITSNQISCSITGLYNSTSNINLRVFLKTYSKPNTELKISIVEGNEALINEIVISFDEEEEKPWEEVELETDHSGDFRVKLSYTATDRDKAFAIDYVILSIDGEITATTSTLSETTEETDGETTPIDSSTSDIETTNDFTSDPSIATKTTTDDGTDATSPPAPNPDISNYKLYKGLAIAAISISSVCVLWLFILAIYTVRRNTSITTEIIPENGSTSSISDECYIPRINKLNKYS